MGKNVLILGGAGFIGSHLCDYFIKDPENNVICIDDFSSSSIENIRHLLKYENFKFLKLNINENFKLEDFPELQDLNLEGQGIQEIYNLASPNNPKDFEDLKEKTLLTNSIGVINSLRIAKKYNSKYFYASSSAIYGGHDKDVLMFSENDLGRVNTVNPRAAYDEGKRFAETVVTTYASIYNIEVHIGRIFRTYGPRMMVNVGHLIPDIISHALNNEEIVIYGRKDLVVAFCYIDDMIEGILKTMQHSDYTLPVNLGSSDAYRLADIIHQILYLTESESKVKFELPLPFTKVPGIADLSLAKEKIGWFPIVNINEGLIKTIEYTMSKLGVVKFHFAEKKSELIDKQ